MGFEPTTTRYRSIGDNIAFDDKRRALYLAELRGRVARSWGRTNDLPVNSRTLLPLSYTSFHFTYYYAASFKFFVVDIGIVYDFNFLKKLIFQFQLLVEIC